jgi:hypothetical protein
MLITLFYYSLGEVTDLSVERPVSAAASVSLVPIIGAVLAALALLIVLIDLSCCRLNNAGQSEFLENKSSIREDINDDILIYFVKIKSVLGGGGGEGM